MKSNHCLWNIACIMTGLAVGAAAQGKRSIVPSDCVTVHYLKDDYPHSPIQFNPQGTLFSYLLKSPNLQTNENDISLYVRPLLGISRTTGPAFNAPGISSMQWLADGRHIVFLARDKGAYAIESLDTTTGKREVLVRTGADIVEYSIDRSGSTIVFATQQQEGERGLQWTPEEIATGYRIPFNESGLYIFPKRRLFITRWDKGGFWPTPSPLTVRSPFSDKTISDLPTYQRLYLSLSPDGRRLVFRYLDEKMPDEWKASPFGRRTSTIGFPGVVVTVLLDLNTGVTSVPARFPFITSLPLWSSDSGSFVVAGYSPVGSNWEKEDFAKYKGNPGEVHLFRVMLHSGLTDKVVDHIANGYEQPLYWGEEGRLLVHTSDNSVSELTESAGRWKALNVWTIPHLYRNAALASDGQRIIGDYQDTTTPPSLSLYEPDRQGGTTLVRLNPQFDDLTLASPREVQWTTSTGYEVHGVLLEPPYFKPGIAYPLVIQTKPYSGQFVCDTGDSHYPSFVPEPIANAGMLYLMRTYPEDYLEQDEREHYPKGYPGQIAEAAFQMDIWDSAVKAFSARGLVDSNRVGLIGFSRSGWYTEFALAHSKIRYRAATAADNAEYSLGESWYLHTTGSIQGYDAMYSGPPFGSSLKNWLDYSVSFNLDKFHTPLLMEEMGYGRQYTNRHEPPDTLAMSFEVFAGLNRLNKPVELYYYPNEEHQIDHPKARLATLQRNLDWYRFWLQGYERPNPEDPDQYLRWRHLRTLEQHEAPTEGLQYRTPDNP